MFDDLEIQNCILTYNSQRTGSKRKHQAGCDFWDELPEHVKSGVLESQEQFKQGKFSTLEEVMVKYKTKYNLRKLFGQKIPNNI